MAREEHIALLLKGVQVWNEWRLANPEVLPDLSNVDLDGIDLVAVNLEKTDLAGASLKNCDLRWAVLNGAITSQTMFDGSNLRGSTLDSSSFSAKHPEIPLCHRLQVSYRIEVLISKLSASNLSEIEIHNFIQELASYGAHSFKYKPLELLRELPNSIKLDPAISPLLKPTHELGQGRGNIGVRGSHRNRYISHDLRRSSTAILSPESRIEEAYYCLIKKSLDKWHLLSSREKILCLCRVLQDSDDFPSIFSTLKGLKEANQEKDLLVKAILNLMRAKDVRDDADKVFNKAHAQITEYVINAAKSSLELINRTRSQVLIAGIG